jgi:hypothetical protein
MINSSKVRLAPNWDILFILQYCRGFTMDEGRKGVEVGEKVEGQQYTTTLLTHSQYSSFVHGGQQFTSWVENTMHE